MLLRCGNCEVGNKNTLYDLLISNESQIIFHRKDTSAPTTLALTGHFGPFGKYTSAPRQDRAEVVGAEVSNPHRN